MNILVLVLTFIRFVAVLYHVAGFYLLYKSQNTSLCRNQRLYLMNFSFSEIMLCALGVLKRICQLVDARQAQNYILIIQWTGFSLGYYLAMILLTIDRFLKFMLDIKYATYWTTMRTKGFIYAAWALCVVFGVLSLIFIPKDEKKITRMATLYFFSAFDITFVVIACLSYGALFRTLRHVKERRRLSRLTNIDRSINLPKLNQRSSDRRKIKEDVRNTLNVLFVPTWILITFLLFIMLPDQLYFYCFILKITLNGIWDKVIDFTYCVGFISDATIYIFLSPPVRKTLMYVLRKHFYCLKPSKSYSSERQRILQLRNNKEILPQTTVSEYEPETPRPS